MLGKKTGGRTKGVPNKFTTDLKQMILSALDQAGGANYLISQSLANPTAFLTLVGKVLPLTLSGDKDNPLKTQTDMNPADRDLIQRYLTQKEIRA